MNHNPARGLVARCNQGKGSLSLTVLPEGVRYEFEVPDSPIGQELLSNLTRGEINASSFAFKVGAEIWEKRENDYLRTITGFDYIFDFSAVYAPAYTATSCTLREGSQRNTDEWYEGHKRARISGEPGPDEHKLMNCLSLLNLQPGDTVDGAELQRMLTQVEARGVKIPEKANTSLTHTEAHEYRMQYINMASDIKPEIKRAYKLSPEDQALWDKYVNVRDNKK